MTESIGAALKAGREQRRLTLAQVSEATRVRVHYLQALENDDLSAMPSAAQGRGFMRIYAQFLNLDLDVLIPPTPPLAAPGPPVVPADATEAAPTNPEGTAQSTLKIPELLGSLRDGLVRRMSRRGRAGDSEEAPASDAEPEGKKKARS